MPMTTDTLLKGLEFPEGPRWHDGKLWFSDMQAYRVMTVDLLGNTEIIVEMPTNPSGLGWLPDGRLLVVSMPDRRLLRLDPGSSWPGTPPGAMAGLVAMAGLGVLSSISTSSLPA